jgi:hypothetical protein
MRDQPLRTVPNELRVTDVPTEHFNQFNLNSADGLYPPLLADRPLPPFIFKVPGEYQAVVLVVLMAIPAAVRTPPSRAKCPTLIQDD